MDEIEKFMNSKSMNNKGKLKQRKGDYKPCQLASKARQQLGEMEYLVKFQRLKLLYKKGEEWNHNRGKTRGRHKRHLVQGYL